jgi:hypothetical protein
VLENIAQSSSLILVEGGRICSTTVKVDEIALQSRQEVVFVSSAIWGGTSW